MNPYLFFIAAGFLMALYFGYAMVKAQILLDTERKLRTVDQDHLEGWIKRCNEITARYDQAVKTWGRIAVEAGSTSH